MPLSASSTEIAAIFSSEQHNDGAAAALRGPSICTLMLSIKQRSVQLHRAVSIAAYAFLNNGWRERGRVREEERE